MIDGAGSQTAVRGSSSTALEFCAETDSLRWSEPDSNSRSRCDGQRYGVRSLKRRLDRRGMTSGAARNGLRFSLFYSVSHSMRPTAHSGRAGCGGPCPKVDVYQRR
jgi:hypothetical protein